MDLINAHIIILWMNIRDEIWSYLTSNLKPNPNPILSFVGFQKIHPIYPKPDPTARTSVGHQIASNMGEQTVTK